MKQNSILYVCPSSGWGGAEGQILRDMEILLQEGWKVSLYCLKETYLHHRANDLDIDLFFHQEHKASPFSKWQKLLNMRKIFSGKQFDIVHCYELNSFWALSFILGSSPLIPLLVSINHELRRSYRYIWYRSLINRADLFLLPTLGAELGLSLHLKIPRRKIHCIFPGIVKVNSNTKAIFSGIRIGSYISNEENDLSRIFPLLHTINILRSQKENEDIRLVLFTDESWSAVPIYNQVSRVILDMGLEDLVLFQNLEKDSNDFFSLTLWVDLNQEELFSYFSLSALIQGVPVVMPRSSSSRILFEIEKGIGEVYKAGDSRELREKCLRIIESHQEYVTSLERAKEKLESRFDLESYKKQLLTTYNSLMERRQRWSKRKRR